MKSSRKRKKTEKVSVWDKDRYIPNRLFFENRPYSYYPFMKSNENINPNHPVSSQYSLLLESQLKAPTPSAALTFRKPERVSHKKRRTYKPVQLSMNLNLLLDAPMLSQQDRDHPLTWGDNSRFYIALDNVVYRYETDSKQLYKLTNPHDSSELSKYRCLGYQPHLNQIVAANEFGMIRCFDAESETIKTNHVLSTTYLTIHESLSDNLSLLGDNQGHVYQFDQRLPIIADMKQFTASSQTLCSLSYNGQNRVAIGDHQGQVSIWDIRYLLRPELWYKKHQGEVKALHFSPFNKELVISSGQEDKQIHLWRLDRKKSIRTCQLENNVPFLFWHDKHHVLSIEQSQSSNVSMKLLKVDIEHEELRTTYQLEESYDDNILFAAHHQARTNQLISCGQGEKVRIHAIESVTLQAAKKEKQKDSKSRSNLIIR